MKDQPKPTRATVLHTVTQEILTRQDGRIPTDVDHVDTFFADEEDLADALLLRWHTLLTARIERALAEEPDDREASVIEALCHAAKDYRGVRLVIDELATNPPTEAVARAARTTARHDWAAMAVAAGLASDFDEPAIRIGHRLELAARQRMRADDATRPASQRESALSKLKAMLTD
jgi:hypothetical protein